MQKTEIELELEAVRKIVMRYKVACIVATIAAVLLGALAWLVCGE